MDCVAAGKPARFYQRVKRPFMKHTYERAFYGLQETLTSAGVSRHTKLYKMACFLKVSLL
jgi:hypothetical protein